jgi:hypothetical protein
MASERVQRQIDRLLDEAEAAIAASEWNRVRDRSNSALAAEGGDSQGEPSYTRIKKRQSIEDNSFHLEVLDEGSAS